MKKIFAYIEFGLKIGILAAGVAIALGFLVPGILTPLTQTNCRPDETSRELRVCEPVRPALGFVQMTVSTVGYFIAPVWLGITFALFWAFRENRRFWKTFSSLMVAGIVMLVVFILFEILFYRPWDSTPYNRFELNRLYASEFGILVPFGAIFGYLITVVFTKRLWKSFQPLGFLPPKKST